MTGDMEMTTMKSATAVLALAVLASSVAFGEAADPAPKMVTAEGAEAKKSTKGNPPASKNKPTVKPKAKRVKGSFKFTLNGLADSREIQ